MTIVFFSPRFYPQIGGVEKHAFEIAKRLSRKHKVIVITEEEKDKIELLRNIKVVRLYFGENNWFKKFRIWVKILKYKKLIEKADIVHCHDVFFWYLPLRIIYPTKKVYVTFHGYETVFPPKPSAIFIRKLSEKLSSGNIIIGEYIRKWYGTNPDKVIYGAIDKVKSSKFRVKNLKLRILFIGRIEKDTGVEIYSKVLSMLKGYKFEACGDGSLSYEFQRFGKVHGFVKNLNIYISKADIVFASSYLSIMEALYFRKPVFSVYDNLLKRDYLKMTPFRKWIYVESSPKLLIMKIEKILRNKKLREKKINLAYNWVKDQTWEKVFEQYLTLWK